jgi:ABC-type Mn2+/Zn2+ transport system ATPase subunit
MLQRLYVHNFRCLQNFELNLKEIESALLIGKNGVGKSTILTVLELLQKISQGVNRMRDLLAPTDFSMGNIDSPIRIEIELHLEHKLYKYILALDLPERFKELRIFAEELLVDGAPIYSRNKAEVTLQSTSENRQAQFLVDWHLVALPVIQQPSEIDPLNIFKTWLGRTILLAPIPSLMTGDSNGETLEPKKDGSNFGEWFSGLLSSYPAAYTEVDKYIRAVIPDIQDVINEKIGKDAKSMRVRFEANRANLSVYFDDLSDGEKCLFLGAVVLAANKFYGPIFCFWDEPDNYISLSEVAHFITSLRRSFQNNSQILVTSHNPEAIRRFSDENTFVLDRKSHLEPTLIRLLRDLSIEGDLINSLICGEIEL